MDFNSGEPNGLDSGHMAPVAIEADTKASMTRASLATLALGAIGIVYGDIGFLCSARLKRLSCRPRRFPLHSSFLSYRLGRSFQPATSRSARIGKLSGPIMAIWSVIIGVLESGGVVQYPGVLIAIAPHYGLAYLFIHGFKGSLILGGI